MVRWLVHRRWLLAGRGDNLRAQAAQAELGGCEVIDASLQVGKITANQIKLDLVERPGAGGGAKVEFAAGIFSPAGDAGGEVQELGRRFQIERCVGLGGTLSAMAERAATPVWRTSEGKRMGSSVG